MSNLKRDGRSAADRDDLTPFSTWRHTATGSTYTVIGLATCSTNGERDGSEQSVVYVSHTYQRLRYREVGEFLGLNDDGEPRFTRVG